MKYFLLLMIITTSCLPRDKNFRQEKQANEETKTNDDNQGTGDSEVANPDQSRGKNTQEEILSYKYRFTGGEHLAIKIDRKGDGNFSKLQVIDLGNNSAINSIPLSLLPQVIAGRANIKSVYLFVGDSYTRGGYYHLSYDDDPTKTSTTKLINNPPQIEFTKFKRDNGQDVVQQGSITQKLTASEWQQLAGQRPKIPSFSNPSPLSNDLQQWFNDEFNIGFKNLKKLEHNRAITIAGNTHYGAIYQGYDGKNSCWTQLWGFDDIAVVKFFHDLNLTLLPSGEDESPAILCKNDNHLIFACKPNYIKEQEVLQIVNNNLIVRDANGEISVHINSEGKCFTGAP